ncbi:bifunctional oligoribonuclease/PAP phosphatase NrnA [Herbivorax sp. ANBcel31]|uniref:DHH family phosphoesterase n=1 Tax=Herbivorax sp. ANBcel31 TaxID=3069754 RepID=UPI0027B27D21|nr:bifunctional oligoribonuclease/PAP phosphatase NrnA [Herbivorax sp. ANBcel31]MDQ2086894.1 bifunctional oligoribonuclease/PAP phosphatase NrnA [Herbivorax sp. ANBcel31]
MIESNIISTIKEVNTVAILPHVSIDGDALGSSIALAYAVKELGIEPIIYIEEEIPLSYNFLPGTEFVEVYQGEVKKYDLVLALDTGDIERLGKRVEILKSASDTINIDHHATNTEFARLNLVKTTSSATGEIIYQLIKMMGLSLTKEISTCIYVAITTDTGGFRYKNTTSVTHQIVSDLIDNGVDVSWVSQLLFETMSLPKTKLMGLAIETLQILEDGKVAVITVTDNMIKNAGAREEDCDGIVNIGRNIRGIEVAVLIRQNKNESFKINLRSKKYVDVSVIANKLGGGGHKNAAGCTINGYMDDIKAMLLKEIKKVL